MVEIHMDYKKGRMTSRMEDTMIGGPKKMAGEMALEMIPIVGGIIQFVRVAADLGADIAHGKLKKSVTIDACSTCFIFWLDRGEIIQITANDLTAKNKNSSVKVAPPNSQPSPGVVTASKSEVE
jgi:hypothetical protein